MNARTIDPFALAPDDTFVEKERVVLTSSAADAGLDPVAREEPLEIQLGTVPLGVVMRTPGHDRELVLGWLLAEGIITVASQVAMVRYCPAVERLEAERNVIQVRLAPEVEVDLRRLQRRFLSSSSCGLCGKASIEAVLGQVAPLADSTRLCVEVLYGLPARLLRAQEVFARTGGLHAAGLFDLQGQALVVREDIGRHNAVDKVVGWAIEQASVVPSRCALLVSGRVSFEVAQKAIAARIPIVAAVSAPSSLAVDLAREANLTLVGFLRGRRACVYSAPERLVGSARD